MFRKAMMMVLTILSGADIGLLWTGGHHLVQVNVGGEVDHAYTAPAHGNSPASGSSQIVLPTNGNDENTAPQASWVALKPAGPFVNPLTADGSIELVGKQQVVLQVDGVIINVTVKPGDEVKAGDLLLTLDDNDLTRSVNRAELDLDTAQAELAKLEEGSSAEELASAQANLDAANANLVKAQQGATPAELQAAQSRLAAAQVRYQELNGPPSGADVDEVKAELEKAQIAVQTAQRAYDAIGGKTRADIGTTAESQRLYEATVELQRVQAKFDRINKGSSQSSLQDAVSNIEKAKSDLADLKAKPNPADVAEAQAKVKEAEEKLAKLQAGASASEKESAEVKVQKAQLDLDEAKLKLEHSKVVAPIDGTVLDIAVTPGERGLTGKVVATLANTKQLKLTVKVAEIDVAKINSGQPVTITLDALRDRALSGLVESIAPINQDNKEVVNYPVTIRLTDNNLDGVRPGMSARVKLSESNSSANSWLAPQNAIHQTADGAQTVTVQRGETTQEIPVSTGENHGEWIVVQSSDLKLGDVVQGSVTSGTEESGASSQG
ncbi:MAG: HlyD family efflux transporter periplasmic adaptor subunit [Caldilineaceae bacterium]